MGKSRKVYKSRYITLFNILRGDFGIMGKKQADLGLAVDGDLGLLVSDSDPQATEDLILAVARALRLKDQQSPFTTEKSLCDDYFILQSRSKLNSSESVLTYLEMVEGQASWFVLLQSEQKEKVSKYSYEERQARFINSLYSEPDKFGFFDIREQAISHLAHLGIIKKERYIPEQPKQLS